MRIVLGVLEPDGGEVRWSGRPLDAGRPAPLRLHARGARAVPEDARADQLVHLARLHGVDGRRRPRGGRSTGSTASGSPRSPTAATETLSLGNQQRAQLAAALVHDPELLVLDEPFSGLDPVGVDVLSEVLVASARGRECPVVFSSHQLELVERLCDAVAIVAAGGSSRRAGRRAARPPRRARGGASSSRGRGRRLGRRGAERGRRPRPTPTRSSSSWPRTPTSRRCSTPPAAPAACAASRPSSRPSPTSSARWWRDRGRPGDPARRPPRDRRAQPRALAVGLDRPHRARARRRPRPAQRARLRRGDERHRRSRRPGRRRRRPAGRRAAAGLRREADRRARWRAPAPRAGSSATATPTSRCWRAAAALAAHDADDSVVAAVQSGSQAARGGCSRRPCPSGPRAARAPPTARGSRSSPS